MSYKNTMKLFVSNFTLAWKQLVYLLICAFLFALCSYTLVSPVISVLREAGLFSQIKNLMNMFYNNPEDIAMTLSEIVKLILTCIGANFSKIYLNLIATVILCIILPYVLYQASIYNLSSMLYQKFTMNMEVNYCQNFLSNFWKSIRFGLTSLLFSLPFFVVNILLVISYILIADTVLLAIIGLAVLSFLSLMIHSAQLTIFSHFTGSVIANESNPFPTFLKSFPISIKHFIKITGSSIILILTAILVNGFIGLFTFFAGLIITLPATCVLMCIFKIVTFLNINGNRYYLSNSVIFNPQKYVVKKDEYVSSFIPPEETKEVTTTKMKKNFKSKSFENAMPKKIKKLQNKAKKESKKKNKTQNKVKKIKG